ncbi:MAG: carboxypeptidase M32 [Chlamydiales bacterium]|nr:carboxypeptidase M32 [Chlamydiales bacterium]
MDTYTKFHELSKTVALLHSIHQLLEWDQEIYMPPGAIEARALQVELIAGLSHKQKTSPAYAKALGKLIDLASGEILDKTLPPEKMAALREWRRDYLNEKKLPQAFVKNFAKITSAGVHAWAEARKQNNFSLFAPHLEKIVKISRKKAELLGYKAHPYDALLDLYEPGMTSAQLSPLFARLKSSLTQLVKEIKARPAPREDFLHGSFSPEKQNEFSQILLKAMGFDKETSRLDLSVHPFCVSLHPKDTRMSTRLHPDYLMSNIFSVIHEGGHGLYNRGFKVENFGSPLGESASLGMDESQSRWWETRIGRSEAFWKHFFPQLQNLFPEKLKEISLHDFHRAINSVEASLIRVEADEVTYSLHVIVRFELEMALLDGSLKVKDLPKAWNRKMQEYLGITPSSDAEGCLQDIHWSMGGIGYFPTYTLGNLYASQIFAAFEKKYPEWKERVSKGDLGFIREWLTENLHQYGRQFSAEEILIRLTGGPLTEKPFVTYLEEKYHRLYDIAR